MKEDLKESTYILLQGGIGDYLQYLPFLIKNRHSSIYRYIVSTHQNATLQILEYFGIKPYSVYKYNDIDELLTITPEINKNIPLYACPRSNFFDTNPLPSPKIINEGNEIPIIGVHLWGSQYSSNTAKKLNLQSKNIPTIFLKKITKFNFKIFLFGAPSELNQLEIANYSNKIQIISNENIIESLKYVNLCNAVIAADSSIKTMSAMLRIPTLVFVSNNEDKFRDEHFISPYLNKSNMAVFQFSNLEDAQEQSKGFDVVLDFLVKTLNIKID